MATLAGPRRRGYSITAMAETRPYYITTAISYPNDAPHIGHAYEAVRCACALPPAAGD